MNSSASDHERVHSAFVRALDVPVGERPVFVRRVLGDRQDLADRVVRMLDGAGTPPGRGPSDGGGGPTASWDDPLLALDRLGGYRVLGAIGRGGMAVVLHAEHVNTGREVALKVLPLGSGSPALRERLARENDVLRSLKHPNVARWRDGGTLDTPEGARPFVAMDYVHGRSLLEWVRAEDPSPRRRLRVLEQIARAVAHAHDHGVVHRDLKPTNVLVDGSDRAVVLDFGVAKVLSEVGVLDHTLTLDGQVVGTLRFMSPEQARGDGKAIGPATDVHALGLMVHEVMTGVPPYTVPSSIGEALSAIAQAEIAPPEVDDPGLREALGRIAEATLARDPADRLADAGLLADDLRAAAHGERVPRRFGRWRRSWRRWRRPLAMAVTLLAVAGFTAVLSPGRRAPTVAPEATLPTVRTLLQEATTALHRSERTPASLEDTIERLHRARTLLNSIPPGPSTPEWQRFLHWRLGEAHYFLGSLRRDPASFSAAFGAWETASSVDRTRAGLEAVDPGDPLRRDIEDITVSRALQGRGLAHAALASYRDPGHEWWLSMLDRRSALKRLAHERGLASAEPDDFPPRSGDTQQGLVRNELGESLMMIADLRGEIEFLDQAFEQFTMVESADMLRSIASAKGSFRYNVGRAYTVRAILTGDPAALDDATDWLERSLELRGAADRLTAHVESHRALLRVGRLRARFASDPTASGPWMLRAIARAERIETAHGDAIHPHDRGLLAAEVARTAVEVALDGDTAALDVADEWFSRAAETITRKDQPVAFAYLLVDRARAARARVVRGLADPALGRRIAERDLFLAESVFPRAQLPRLHGTIDAERAEWAVLVGARDD